MNDRWRDDDRRRWEEREREQNLRRSYGSDGGGYGRNSSYQSRDEDRGQGRSFFGGSDYSRTEDYQRNAGARGQNSGQNSGQGYGQREFGPNYHGVDYRQDHYSSTWGASDRSFEREPYRGEWGGGPQSGYNRPGETYDARRRETYAEGGYGRDQGYGGGRQYEGYARNQRHHDDHESRSWVDKARDEVGAWFGDHDAEERRRRDAAREGHPYESRRDDTGWSDRFSGEDRYRAEQERRDRWNRNDW